MDHAVTRSLVQMLTVTLEVNVCLVIALETTGIIEQ